MDPHPPLAKTVQNAQIFEFIGRREVSLFIEKSVAELYIKLAENPDLESWAIELPQTFGFPGNLNFAEVRLITAMAKPSAHYHPNSEQLCKIHLGTGSVLLHPQDEWIAHPINSDVILTIPKQLPHILVTDSQDPVCFLLFHTARWPQTEEFLEPPKKAK